MTRYMIYNNMRASDWLAHTGGLPEGTLIIMNNETYSLDVVNHLNSLGYEVSYSQKLCDGVLQSDVLDSENYHDDIVYNSALGLSVSAKTILPENLGGDKYENYDDFLFAANPRNIVLERTYSCWWPWDLKTYWDRNQYLRDAGYKTYMGIWIESIPSALRSTQWAAAKSISGGRVLWYSETKELPKRSML